MREDLTIIPKMKIRNIAWMGVGLLLAGAAGAAVAYRRKENREIPAEPEETKEHAALRAILEQSVAYNEALYERVLALEKVPAPAARPATVAEITRQNQDDRRRIDAMRAELQKLLDAQGHTFNDVDGFVELISEYRSITLKQQKRHVELFQRVRKMENVPQSPELHAYLKLGFKDEPQRNADTYQRLTSVKDEQRELMLRAGRLMSSVTDAETADSVQQELNKLGDRYTELTDIIRMYREDDAAGAEQCVQELRALYAALLPMLQENAARLSHAQYYENAALKEVLERMLPQTS